MDFIKRLEELSYDDDFSYENKNNPTTCPSQSDFRHFSQYHEGLLSNIYGIKTVDVYSSRSNHSSVNEHEDHTLNTVNSSSVINPPSNTLVKLISTLNLSDKGRSIFKFSHFNRMQSLSFNSVYETDGNCVISSPTGSGKTVLFELAILRLLNKSKNMNNFKILYVAPTKALCIERQRDWDSKFSIFGLTVGTLTSDTSFLETEQVKRSNIIITTPEKWDLMTRKWNDYNKLFGMIRLLLIDEIHILRENRGSTLEVVITRMKKICSDIRIIAVSATVPNIHDISSWIKLNSTSSSNALTLIFGEEFRPVKLSKAIYGYKQSCNDFVFDSILNSKLIELLNQHSEDKPVLIFCPTRNSTIKTAKYISEHFRGIMNLNKNITTVRQKDLMEISRRGVSFHHAGLSLEDRDAVEKNFINGSTKILCSTSTLAVGVNLPAYLVIIKGTKIWNTTQFEEYSELDVLQMMGRAGRPQFETQGKVILMTSLEKKITYENLIKGNEKLESKLHMNLYENFVSETYLKTITSLEDSLDWLKNTFFYARYSSNPTAYDEIPYIANTDLDGRLMRYCESKLRELLDFKMIHVVNGSYQSTTYGDAMTRHYISFKTMKQIIRSKDSLSVSEILLLVSKSEEFSTIRLKRTERKLYKTINESTIMKYPLKSDNNKSKNISSNWEKIYLLIQYELGGLEYPTGPEFQNVQQTCKQDKFFVFKHLIRIIKCLIDCLVEKKDYISLKNCLILYRSVNGKGWENTPMVLRQISGIGLVYVRKFANQGISTFQQINALEATKVEYILGQRPGQGIKIKQQIESLPKLSIELKFLSANKSKSDESVVHVRLEVILRVESASKWNGKSLTVNVLCGLSTGELVDFRRAHITKVSGQRSSYLDLFLISSKSMVECYISCEEIAGLLSTTTLRIVDELPKNLSSLLRLKSSCKEDELEEEEEEDDDIDDLLIQASAKLISNKTTTREREKFKDGTLKCKHTCKDKTSCRHLCCREGLAPKSNKKTNKGLFLSDSKSPGFKQSNLSGLSLLDHLHTKSRAASATQIEQPNKRKYLSKYSFHSVSNEASIIPVKRARKEVKMVDDCDDEDEITFDALEILNKDFQKGDCGLNNYSRKSNRRNDVVSIKGTIGVVEDGFDTMLNKASCAIEPIYDIIDEDDNEIAVRYKKDVSDRSIVSEEIDESNTDFELELASDIIFGSDVDII